MPAVMGSITFTFRDVPVVADIVTGDLVRYEIAAGTPAPERLSIPEQARLAHLVALRLQRQHELDGVPAEFDAFLDGVDFPAVSAEGKAAATTRPRNSSRKSPPVLA